MAKRLASHLRPLDSREEKLDTLLENYTDANDTLYASHNLRGGVEDRLLGMPLVWNLSYRELERALKRMYVLSDIPGQASPGFRAMRCHVVEWYMRAQRKRTPVMRKGKRGRLYPVDGQWELRVIRKGNPGLVLAGLEWLSSEFVGEVYLPREFLDVAA